MPTIDLEKLDEKGLPRPNETCTKCKTWTDHIVKAGMARRLYRADKRQVEKGEPIYAADLEKVIMLPRLPGIKTAIFTRRIIFFNETFAPVGGHGKALGYLWHEGIRGRNDHVHTSSFYPARNSRIRHQSRYGRIIVKHRIKIGRCFVLFCITSTKIMHCNPSSCVTWKRDILSWQQTHFTLP